MKKKFVDYYMTIADVTAKLSYAKRLQVGAVIVKGNQILATGYNGMPSGWDNNCETELPESIDLDSRTITPKQLVTKPEVIHAESNALTKVARSTESSEGATMFCTHAPCIECAKLIFQSGITTLYFKEHYRSDSGIKFLLLSDVKVHEYNHAL